MFWRKTWVKSGALKGAGDKPRLHPTQPMFDSFRGLFPVCPGLQHTGDIATPPTPVAPCCGVTRTPASACTDRSSRPVYDRCARRLGLLAGGSGCVRRRIRSSCRTRIIWEDFVASANRNEADLDWSACRFGTLHSNLLHLRHRWGERAPFGSYNDAYDLVL